MCLASATFDLEILGPSIHCSSDPPLGAATGILLPGESFTLAAEALLDDEFFLAGLAFGVALCAGEVCLDAVCVSVFTVFEDVLWAGLRSSGILLGLSAAEPRSTRPIAQRLSPEFKLGI